MASEISPKAEISPNAKIGENCKIFPFVYIEDDVEIGDNCIIFPFVSICNGSRIGNNNKIHQGSVIAALPQDFNFRGAKSYVRIGNNNVIRENVANDRCAVTLRTTVDDDVLTDNIVVTNLDIRLGASEVEVLRQGCDDATLMNLVVATDA